MSITGDHCLSTARTGAASSPRSFKRQRDQLVVAGFDVRQHQILDNPEYRAGGTPCGTAGPSMSPDRPKEHRRRSGACRAAPTAPPCPAASARKPAGHTIGSILIHQPEQQPRRRAVERGCNLHQNGRMDLLPRASITRAGPMKSARSRPVDTGALGIVMQRRVGVGAAMRRHREAGDIDRDSPDRW